MRRPRKGDTVVVIAGPWAGQRGKVVDVLGNGTDCTEFPFKVTPLEGELGRTDIYAETELEVVE